jgi:hypothetical protein
LIKVQSQAQIIVLIAIKQILFAITHHAACFSVQRKGCPDPMPL